MQVQSQNTNATLWRASWAWISVEVVIVLVIFAAAGAWPTPDSNEAHYLTKARHFFDPSWCAGDFFLESQDAHDVFYWLVGPLAAGLPLPVAAWVGRWLGWLSLAIGFRHAVRPLLETPLARLLAAALFSLALRHTTAAGEWVIGGCEAKVFAWAFVLWAAGEIALGKFSGAWLALGAATALHPIVGGWGMIALLLASSPRFWQQTSLSRGDCLRLVSGTVLAAVGVVPAFGLASDADAAQQAAATTIYVVERLPHHLLPRTFADGFVARHVLAILLWCALSKIGPTDAPRSLARTRLRAFVFAAIAISIVGCAIALLEPLAPGIVHQGLRFYWFRLADGLVPLALATAAAAGLCAAGSPTDQGRWRRFTVAVVSLLLIVDTANESRHWPLPWRADVTARSDTKVVAGPWRDSCEWVCQNLPVDSCFLTPRGAASFIWRTGRREVVAWKNIPQDSRSLVEWRTRIVDCFSRSDTLHELERSTAALGFEQMHRVAQRYGANYAILPLDVLASPGFPPGGKGLWTQLYANDGYAVYRLNSDPIESPPPATAP